MQSAAGSAASHTAALNLGNTLLEGSGRQNVFMKFQGSLKMWKNQLKTITFIALRNSLEQKILGV